MSEEKDEFYNIIDDLVNNETVKKMQDFRQHYNTSCYEHCLKVAFYSYLICKKFNLDYKAAARSGMLHDLFLYDWRKRSTDRKSLHAFRHPRIALNNSLKLTNLSCREQDIILKHMWPLTIALPRYKESYIVSFVDKYCALAESICYYKQLSRVQKIYRYSYVFFGLMIFRII